MTVPGGSGGETAKDPSGWSTDTLKAYFERIVSDMEQRLQQRFEAVENASGKYEKDVERWRANSNEWRAAMDDREERFVQVATFNARMGGLEHQLAALDQKIDDLTRSRDLAAGRQTAQTAILAFVFAAITIALRFV